MIKNIILDIGGIIIDDSKENLEKVLNKPKKYVNKLSEIVYGKRFKQCLLGNLTIQEYMKELIEQYPDISVEIEKILKPENYATIIPVKEETTKLIKKLKEKDFKIYLLSNFTEESYDYLKNKIEIIDNIDGGIFSWQEHLIKPDSAIYELLIKKYNINKEESIFFDDKEKNVKAGNDLGIRSVKFKTVKDIINAIN